MPATRKKATTLRDIAQKADVSTALVSCILNGKGRASEAVRTKVLAMLEQAGYRPKYARRSFYFVVDIDRISESGKSVPFMRMLKGVEKVLDDEGIHLQVEFLSHSERDTPQGLAAQFQAILERQPGAVLVPTDETWLDRACAFFAGRNIPLMQLGYDTENPRYPAVVVDSYAGAGTATGYLVARGHKRVGVLRWDYSLAGVNGQKKLAGYRDALAQAGIEFDQTLVRSVTVGQSDPLWASCRDLVDDLLRLKKPPTALFVDNSFLSLPLLYPQPGDRGALPASIRDLDMVHSEDWPLDAVEDIVARKLFYPARQATVLAFDWETIGTVAARMLVDRLRSPGAATQTQAVRVAPVLQRIEGQNRTLMELPTQSQGDAS